MTPAEALTAYVTARNAFDGTRASQQALECAAMRWAEAQMRARGVEPPVNDTLRRHWEK